MPYAASASYASRHRKNYGSTTKERTARSTPAQRQQLQQCFEHNPRPDSHELHILAEDIGMHFEHVSQWFSSKRCRIKKASSRYQTSLAVPAPQNALQLSLPSADADDDAADFTPQPKRGKPRMNTQQEKRLQELFDMDAHASMEVKKNVAYEIGLSLSKVNSWFTFTRATQLPIRMVNSMPPRASSSQAALFIKQEPLSASSSPAFGPSRSLRIRSGRSTPYSKRASLRRTVSATTSEHSDTSSRGSKPRVRTRPTPEQLAVLKREFFLSAPEHKPSLERRTELSEELDMPIAKITDWFRNSLASLKKRGRKHDVFYSGYKDGDTSDDSATEEIYETDSDSESDYMDLDLDEDADDDTGDETEDDIPLYTPRSTVFGTPGPRVIVVPADQSPAHTLELASAAAVLIGMGKQWSGSEIEHYCKQQMAVLKVDTPSSALQLLADGAAAL
ncbi:hypothetical protein EXIGLDRAFT_759547 [Exidia glandulosa HHB12029]|uniref:Homeobox domain-containing protein n=1 Tax=Exidia glandulosa HHB12029 TaxID=1314781 RepID=A0A165PYD5_EXIGL|nr:hypothetical protein EXIGLDRAFT_759547 [Exidia glandulosa HHB12029]